MQISVNGLIYNNLHGNRCNNFYIPNFLDFLWNSNKDDYRAPARIYLSKGKITRLSRLSRGLVYCEISEISGMFFGFAIYARIIRARITRICVV